MAPLFWLEITDWKKERIQGNIPQISIIRYFSTDWKKIIVSKSFCALRYLDNEAEVDVDKLYSKFRETINKLIFTRYNLTYLFSDYNRNVTYPVSSFVTSISLISRIMNTPFEITKAKRKWVIKAEIFNENKICLYIDNDVEDNVSETMAKQYELLKRYFFVKIPLNYNRKLTSAFHELFGELIGLSHGDHQIFYSAEIPGIISEEEITDKDKLRSAAPIYCDIFNLDEFSQDVIDYNPVWWSKASLINAKQCILGAYDKKYDCLKKIIKFDMDKFDDQTKYKNLWSPEAAWNFLDEFLQFVKDVVNSVSEDVKDRCVWKFQSFPDEKQMVSCEILIYTTVDGKEALIPLLVNEINFP